MTGGNRGIGKAIAESLVQHLEASGVSADAGGVLQINGSPTDAAAGLIKKGIHAGLQTGPYKALAEYDTPDWFPANAQEWTSGQISRFGDQIVGIVAANDGTGGGAIAALKAAGTEYEAYIYEGANHGFHNDSTPRYDAEAAELAWGRTVEWFRRTLV